VPKVPGVACADTKVDAYERLARQLLADRVLGAGVLPDRGRRDRDVEDFRRKPAYYALAEARWGGR
jgi:hypothetical protein